MNTPDIIAVKTRALSWESFPADMWSARPVVNFGFAAVCPPMFVIEGGQIENSNGHFLPKLLGPECKAVFCSPSVFLSALFQKNNVRQNQRAIENQRFTLKSPLSSTRGDSSLRARGMR